MSFVLILYLNWLLGPHKGQNFEEKKIKNFIICGFYSSRIRTLVAMGFHRLIMGKVKISYFFWTNCRYLNFVFAEIFIEYISVSCDFFPNPLF